MGGRKGDESVFGRELFDAIGRLDAEDEAGQGTAPKANTADQGVMGDANTVAR